MEKYKEQITARQDEEAKRDNVLRPKLKKTQDERDTTKTQKEEQIKLAEAKGVEVDNQQKKIDDLKKEIAAKEDLVREQKVKIDEINDQLKKLGDIEQLVRDMRVMKDELAQLQSDIDLNTTKLNNMVAEKTRTAGVIKAYEEENAWRNANLSNPKLATNIGAIFDTYGFVTLPVGNNAGVVGGSSLEVVRDGEVIAKLLVKTVEASTAAAEIVPNSIKADTVLMVGDDVRAAAAVPKKAPAAPAAATTPAAPAAETPAAETPAAPAEEAAPAAEDAAAPAEEAAAPAEEKAEEPAAEADPFQ